MSQRPCPVLVDDARAELRREIQDIVRLAAEPLRPNDNVKSRLARAAARLGLGRRRAYAFWHGEAETVARAEEVARFRAERERLLQARMERLGREIAETERLIREAKQRHAATVDVDRRAGEQAQQLGLPFGRRPA